MTDKRRGELLMPVTDEHALKLAEIETQRLIADNLKRLNDHAGKTNEALHAIEIRLTKIEANAVNQDVLELKAKVDLLESERDRRAGMAQTGNWLIEKGPQLLILIGFIVLTVIVLLANEKI